MMVRFSGPPLAALLSIGLLNCGPTSRYRGDPSLSATTHGGTFIHLEPYQGRLRAVRVQAANREWLLLFDTGGGTTVVSPALAEALKCAPRGRITGFRMSGQSITMPSCAADALVVGGWRATPQAIGVFDVMTLVPAEWPRLDGVISLRSFAGHRLTLDLAANAVVVNAQLDVGAKELLGRLATGVSGSELLVFAGIVAGRDTLWLEVDSGNLDAVLLAPHAARVLGMADSVGTERNDLVLSLVPGRPSTVLARVRTLILDGALNAAWLERGQLTMDLMHGRLWWAPRVSPP